MALSSTRRIRACEIGIREADVSKFDAPCGMLKSSCARLVGDVLGLIEHFLVNSVRCRLNLGDRVEHARNVLETLIDNVERNDEGS